MKSKDSKNESSKKWPIIVAFLAFILSFIFAYISNTAIAELDLLPGIIVLLVVIVLGIVFDLIGVSVTIAKEEEFHAMYENGEFLETRTYEIEVPDTDEKVLWYYGYSLEEISKKLQQGNILMIVDLEGFKEFKEIYQKDCIGIYIDVDRDIRVQRYLNRDEINYQNVKECIRRIDDDDNRAFKGYEEWVDWKITPTNSDEAAGAISVIIYGKGEK